MKFILIPGFVFFIMSAFTSSSKEKITFETTYFKVGIDNRGFVTGFTDKKTSVGYLPKSESAPLLTLFKDSVYIKPSAAEYKISEKKSN